MLTIEDLHATTADAKVLCGVNLQVNPGEVHAIMGPNGAGKSTLSKVVAGHPAYEITAGKIKYRVGFDDIDLLEMEPEERARAGVFISFQYPLEIPGLANSEFLRAAFNAVSSAQGAEPLDPSDFRDLISKKVEELKIKSSLVDRELNVDFSGGEKKRNEILQMAVLKPRIAFLDETDSGLDVDALKTVAEGINKQRTKDNAVVLVTHYHRLLQYVKPDFVHVMIDGRIVKTGDESMAFEVEEKGYDIFVPQPRKNH